MEQSHKPRALLSVYDKTGIVDFAKSLDELGFQLISTGGTARKLKDAGLSVISVSDVTGHPEIFDGRVKSLHPAIHGPLLARLESEEDRVGLAELGYGPINLVACNLYPFSVWILHLRQLRSRSCSAISGAQRARRRGRLRVLRDLGSPPLATQRSFRNLARKILKRLSADCPSLNDWSNRIKASSSITDVCLGLLSLWGGPLPSL